LPFLFFVPKSYASSNSFSVTGSTLNTGTPGNIEFSYSSFSPSFTDCVKMQLYKSPSNTLWFNLPLSNYPGTTCSSSTYNSNGVFLGGPVLIDDGNYYAVLNDSSGNSWFSQVFSYTSGVFSTNHPPVVGAVTISPNPVQINTSVTATANFTDPDTGDTHTATANFGDGTHTNVTCSSVTEPSGSTPGSVSCTLSSGYTTANVYPVTITVSDGTAPTTSPVSYASVYNPTQSSIFTAGSVFANPC
jgi:hypothetical protein